MDPFIHQILYVISGYSYTKRLILLHMLAAHPSRVFCTEYPPGGLHQCHNKETLMLGQKKLCLSFLKVKTVSAMHCCFLVRKGYGNAEILPFFLLHFLATILFSLRGRFLTFFPLAGKKDEKI